MTKTLRSLEQYTAEKRPGFAARLKARRPRIRVIEALVKLRRGRSLSQRSLAEKAGVPQPTIARLESHADDRMQTTEKIVEYAKGCGVHVGLVFVAKDGDECAVLETASLSDDEAVSQFLSHLRFLAEKAPLDPLNSDDEKERRKMAAYSV